jgi:hypothetical protein
MSEEEIKNKIRTTLTPHNIFYMFHQVEATSEVLKSTNEKLENLENKSDELRSTKNKLD